MRKWRSTWCLVPCAIVVVAGCGPSSDAGSDGGGGGASPGRDCAEGAMPSGLEGALGPRGDVLVEGITTGDKAFLCERPGLAARKFAFMAADAFSFFRGSLALFLADWNDPAGRLAATRFPAGGARPFGLGDAHPENFGTMRTLSGTFRLEPNDYDTADRLPYLWDVRRFAIGMCLAARLSNPSDPVAQAATIAAAGAIVRATVASYSDTLRALATGAPRPVVETGGGNAVLDDLFARSERDWQPRAELDQLTSTDPVRRFNRGTPDPAEPSWTHRDLPARARIGIAASVGRYRDTLLAPPPVTELVALDAVQEFGVGIGSLSRVRALVLVRGPSTNADDDFLLEVKELPPQGSPPLPVPSAFASPRERLLAALDAGFTERGADPMWGVGTWSGFPVQIRTEALGFKTVRVARLDGPQGAPAAVEGLGVTLARLIARMHAAPVGGTSLAGVIADGIASDPGGFVDEQTDIALAYCGQVMSDLELFKQALALLGSTLGVPGDSANAPSVDLRVLYNPEADPRAAGIDPVVAPVSINEISASGADYVELENVSRASQSIAGYGVADSDVDGGPRFEEASWFAAGATLPPQSRIVVAGGFAPATPGPQTACLPGVQTCYQASWDISASRGETIFLLNPEQVIVDQVFHPSGVLGSGESWGRFPDGAGPFEIGPTSPGKPNSRP